jgi:transposase
LEKAALGFCGGHLVEIFFYRLKRFRAIAPSRHRPSRHRAIAPRYEKTARNYLGLVLLGCSWLWLG